MKFSKFIGGAVVLAAVALVIILALRTSHRVPAALVVLALGLVAAALTWPAGAPLPLGVRFPTLPARWPTPNEFAQAALLLALPQLALSLGNSVLATKQVVADLFPEREPLSVKRIGTTYAFMNLLAAPLGGIPVCHGSGGIAGHYAFGARTGASGIIYGTFLVLSGLLLVGEPAAYAMAPPACSPTSSKVWMMTGWAVWRRRPLPNVSGGWMYRPFLARH